MLQAALLPAGVPILPRVAVGARYLLAEADTAAGGDWYDTVVLSDGSVGLVVGDVVGHGVAASATMGQLRAVARHCLAPPRRRSTLSAALDRFARDLDDAHTATVCVAVLDPTTGALRVSSAGHPPPLLLAAAGPRYLPGPPDRSPRAPPTRRLRTRMADGDLLLLYTDGILERPGVHPAQGGRRPRRRRHPPAGTPRRRPAAQRFCDDVLALLIRSTGYRDDVTLLRGATARARSGRWSCRSPTRRSR